LIGYLILENVNSLSMVYRRPSIYNYDHLRRVTLGWSSGHIDLRYWYGRAALTRHWYASTTLTVLQRC